MARIGLYLGLTAAILVPAAGCATGSGETSGAAQTVKQTDFATPEDAAEALIAAAESYDVEAWTRILGPEGVDLVVTGDPVQDRNQSLAFAAQARVKTQIDRVPLDPTVAIQRLAESGIKAAVGDKMKKVAHKHNTTPFDLFELMK